MVRSSFFFFFFWIGVVLSSASVGRCQDVPIALVVFSSSLDPTTRLLCKPLLSLERVPRGAEEE